MSFSDPFNVCKGLCLAATFTGFYDANVTGTCDGLTVVKLEDSDIVFNNSGPFGSAWTSESEDPGGNGCSGEVFLETVVTYEVGHLIGLGHEDDVTAVMNSSIAACDNQLLTDGIMDDLDGRDTLYDCALGTCQSTCDGNALECGEVCDGTHLGGATCESEGFDSGTLACNGSCTAFDTSGSSITTPEDCSDGLDNDGDTFIDCADPDCTGDPACGGSSTGEEGGRLCRNGVDDDGDGDIDCADSECAPKGFCK